MRQFLIIFSFLTFCSGLSAQDYQPIIINSAAFFKTELETDTQVVPAEITVSNFEMINNQLYNRVFFRRDLEGDVLIGYVREIPEEGQLYFRSSANAQDILVYDISLEEGDVVELDARWCDNIEGNLATVTEVSDINGRREVLFDRQIGYQSICEPLRFIEGVGANASIIFPYFSASVPANGAALSVCHASHEGIIHYPANSDTDLCGLTITSTEEVSSLQFGVYPNPVQSILHISSTDEQVEVRMFDTHNRLLLTTQQATIDMAPYTKGIYILHAIDSRGSSKIMKVIKS